MLHTFAVILLSSIQLTAAFSPSSRDSRVKFETVRPPSVLYASEISRIKRVAGLMEWAKSVGIKTGGVQVQEGKDGAGLGLFASQDIKGNDLVIQVPSRLALATSSTGDTDDDVKLLSMMTDQGKSIYRNAPWWARLSLQLNYLDKTSPGNNNLKSVDLNPWLQSLPRKFSTPVHWSEVSQRELQYRHLESAVRSQRETWGNEYSKLLSCFSPAVSWIQDVSLDDFIWGCECARSRAFSGRYSGSAFNPAPYTFTLLLVTAYIGLDMGTMEQAANGAGLVLCGTVLKDFVLPKLNKSKRHIICPLIDMANHVGTGQQGEVAFEYFGDSYSVAIQRDHSIQKNQEVYISYGERSNDQLLQYYGFVEKGNPHDVYVMPPLREWDINALEKACGKRFNGKALQNLEKAGLLDRAVVITRRGGVDSEIMAAIKALIASNEDFTDEEVERKAILVAKTAIEMELMAKPTSIEQDEISLKSKEDILAVAFRREKKKLLKETLDHLYQ